MNRIPHLFLAALILVGCTKSDNQKHDASSESQPETHPAKAADNLLHIDPEMLRDLRITSSTVEKRAGGDGVSILGEVGVNEDAYSQVASPIAARVTSISISPGERVTKGQELAVLQSTEIGKARSEEITAQSRLQLTRQTLERKKRLAAEKIAAQREVQEAEAAVASAEAELRASRATLQALGASESAANGSELTLRSPISGTVIERTALRGQSADPTQPLFKIADLSTVWLTVHAFERDAVRLQAGKAARVSLPALPGRNFPGKVDLVGRSVDSASRTIPVRITVANGDGVLRPGMSATAWVPFKDASEQIIAVPIASVQRIENEWYVFVPKSKDTFELRAVGRGRDLGGEVEIVKGLQPGETVVVDGAFLLKTEAEKARGEGKEHDHD
jgi:cobalt-zinc-cadmium efflux system membrane fusion protein